ncbi:hypothetical protein [Halobacteriovorax marinus]|uniref:hypothetical protein n=1 Tax=Halobacteriovorax marinus TaxID=97084 RepID=UPI003A8E3FF6
MKKSNSKHLKLIMASLLLSALSQSQVYADILTLPQVDDAPAAVKGELYGPEITTCQEMSGGWKASAPDFNEYALRAAKEAAIDFNNIVKDNAPSLKNLIKNQSLDTLIDFNSGSIQPDYVTVVVPGAARAEYFLLKESDLDLNLVDQNQCPQRESSNTLCHVLKKGSSIAQIPKMNEEELEPLLKQVMTARARLRTKMVDVIDDVARCSALYAVVSNGVSARGMNYSDFNKSQESKSFDGKLKCSSIGYETQDYKACNEAVNYYDAVFVGRKAVETAQSFQYMDKSMDIQTDMAKNAQTDATAGLKAQKEDIQTKAEMARTRAATETAAVGALWAAMGTIPDLDKLSSECKQRVSEPELKEFKNFYKIYTQKLSISSEDSIETIITTKINGACSTHVGNPQTANHALIQNSEAKGIIQQALIDAGMNIATMLGTAEILDKQAGRVGDAIKLVEDHEPESLAYTGEDVAVTECQVNPNSENCVSAQYERGVGYHNDGISVSGMQFATSDSTLPIDDTTTRNTDGASDSTDRGGSVGGIGAPIDPISKGSGLADDPVAAASVAATGANGLGAGGGGGSSGGASGGASAPANGSARTGGQGANKPYVGSSKKLKYSSGGGLSFSSGSKRRVASKSKAENPFSKLFGKKNGNKNGVLNFRGVASDVGSKNGSIFQMISKRYSAVNKDNRLQEYTKK